MNPVDRLDRLSEKVTQTFDPDFIFLIRPEKSSIFLLETGQGMKTWWK